MRRSVADEFVRRFLRFAVLDAMASTLNVAAWTAAVAKLNDENLHALLETAFAQAADMNVCLLRLFMEA